MRTFSSLPALKGMVKTAAVSILALLMNATLSLAQDAPTRGEAALRSQRAAEVAARGFISPASRPSQAAIRDEFIRIERIARLGPDQRGLNVSQLYLEILVPLSKQVSQEQMISSTTPPTKLLEPRGRGATPGRDTLGYGAELDAVVATMSPEQVADTIVSNHPISVLHLASLRRLEFVLTQHPKELNALINADLASRQLEDQRRAYLAIKEMHLKEYTRRIEELMIADSLDSREAANALSWISSDPEAAKPLLEDIAKKPVAIASYQYVLRTMLFRVPPDPILLKLLDSPDADIRNATSVVLEETDDVSAIELIPKLMADPDMRIREAGMRMGFRLPNELFNTVRPSLVPALSSPSLPERVRGAAGFAGKLDAAGAKILLDAAKDPQLPQMLRGTVSTAINRLMQTRIPVRLSPVNWGPDDPQNAKVITQFEQWIASQPK